MSPQDAEFLKKINDYAEEVLGDIDPQKVPVSKQLEKLRPIMQELALKEQMPVEEVFIKYMDLASEANVAADKEIKTKYGLDDTMDLDMPIKFN